MATKSNLNKFVKLKIKLNSLKADIYFLKQCKSLQVFPRFIKINCPTLNERTEKVIISSKKKWLSLERKYLHSKLSDTELELYSIHLAITKDLNTTVNYCKESTEDSFEYLDWLDFLHQTDELLSKTATLKIKKLNKKFRELRRRKKKDVIMKPKIQHVPEYVVNLSNVNFTEKEFSLLNKGLNFAPTPRNIKVDETIIDIETSLKYQPELVKCSVRKEVEPIIKENTNNIRKPNFNDESDTIKSLKEKDVFYLKADKGNSLVILEKSEYDRRVQNTIIKSSFEELNRNPLPQMIKKTNAGITSIANVFKIPKWKLSVPNPLLPSLHALPKIHKPGENMRPIVSNINAPSYKIAKWLEFNKMESPQGLYVKNSFEFVEKISNIELEDDDILVSFDIVSLYPSIPIPEALSYIDEWLNECNISNEHAEIYSEMVKLCMEQNQFQYKGKFYKLSQGTSMGNPLSCFVSNVFMGKFEMQLKNENKLPKTWLRYVDDIFTIMKRHEVEDLKELLNTQYPTIKFTVELEKEGSLPFLDLKLTRTNNKIDIDIYRKSTTTSRYITADSYSPKSHKMAAFNSMVYRMCRLPLSISNYIRELKNIKQIATINGYRENEIDILVKKHSKKLRQKQQTTFFNDTTDVKRVKFQYNPIITNKIGTTFKKHKLQIVYANNRKLKDILGNPKDKIPETKKSGIYEINCGDCENVYIGQTKRNIETRFKEHIAHVKSNRPNKSAVADHVLRMGHLNITNGNLKLKKHINSVKELDAWESYFIYKNKEKLMNIEEAPITSTLFNICAD